MPVTMPWLAAKPLIFAASVCVSRAANISPRTMPMSGIEAMRCGNPVVASDIQVHRDVFGTAAEYFSTYSPSDLARAVAAVIDPARDGHRRALIERGREVSTAYLPERILPQWQSFLQRLPQQKAHGDHDRQDDNRNPGKRAGDQEQHGDEKNCEQQIDEGHHRTGGKKLPHGFEVAQLVGQDADRSRPCRQLQRLHVFEDLGRQHDIDLLARDVDDAAADCAQDEIEDDGDDHADGQCDQ